MNGNLAYLQLDFTVESQANLAPDCMVMQEISKSFRGPRRPPTPRPTLLLGLRPSAHSLRPHAAYGPPLFSDIYHRLIIFRTGEHCMCNQSLFRWWCNLHYWRNNSQRQFVHRKFDANL